MFTYLYRNYVKTLSEQLEAKLSSIRIGYNFEYGLNSR